MTAVEHYRRGEQLLGLAEQQGTNAHPLTVAKAQAHFTAALAAAALDRLPREPEVGSA